MRSKIANCFAREFSHLQLETNTIHGYLKGIISSIMVLSQNSIRSQKSRNKHNQEINFLDQEEIRLIIVCKYVVKALNDYIIDILSALLMGIKRVETELLRLPEDQQTVMVPFMIGNVFRCRCSGSKESSSSVIKELEGNKDIRIVKK